LEYCLVYGIHSGNKLRDVSNVEDLISKARELNINYQPLENLIRMISEVKAGEHPGI